MQPAVGGERGGRGLGLVVVAGRHAQSPGLQFAHLTWRQFTPGVRVDHAVDHQPAAVGRVTGRADVAQAAVGRAQTLDRVVGPRHGARCGDLGHAVAGCQLGRLQQLEDLLPDSGW